MDSYDISIMESKIESGENRIRALHNELESKKLFGKRNYFLYENKKFIAMINLFQEALKKE
jgi:hypothetical protein